MLFSSLFFLQVFLPVLLILYYLLPKNIRIRNLLLLLASLVFYAWGEPEKIAILLISVAVNYCIGIFGLRFDLSDRMRKGVLTGGILLNISILCGFKYAIPVCVFFDEWFHFKFHIPNGELPLGISFYTFQIISYLIDLYRKEIEPQRNLGKLALYITFFPQLIAGPIIKYHDVFLQLNSREAKADDIAIGIKRFICGLSKKVLLANSFAVAADDIFQMPYDRLDTLTAWIGAGCYSLQIYFDFSGYSDMAIGLGRMFGFRFLENFNLPYSSQSIREFWRRWHISLSTWFKEYLYIPLGGNRCSAARNCLNIMIVFLATGIWHGAALNFVCWGIFYGILIVAERLFLGQMLERCRWKIIPHFYTLFAVVMAWVLFRADSLPEAWQYWMKMLTVTSNPELHCSDFFSPGFLAAAAVGVLLCFPFQKMFPVFTEQFCYGKIRIAEIPILLLMLAAVIVQLSGNTYNPFIYFRF